MCVFKNHAFIYFLRPPSWSGTEAMQAEWGRSWWFRRPKAGFHGRMGQCQHLAKAFETVCGILGTEVILTKNTASGRFLAPTNRITQQFLAEFWTPADWPPYSLDLNLLNFSIWRVLQVKVQAMPNSILAALGLSIAVEWDQLTAKYICKDCHLFLTAGEQSPRKMKFTLKRWTVNSPTNTKQYFLGLP